MGGARDFSDEADADAVLIAARHRMLHAPRKRPGTREYLPQPIKAGRADGDLGSLKKF